MAVACGAHADCFGRPLRISTSSRSIRSRMGMGGWEGFWQKRLWPKPQASPTSPASPSPLNGTKSHRSHVRSGPLGISGREDGFEIQPVGPGIESYGNAAPRGFGPEGRPRPRRPEQIHALPHRRTRPIVLLEIADLEQDFGVEGSKRAENRVDRGAVGSVFELGNLGFLNAQ